MNDSWKILKLFSQFYFQQLSGFAHSLFKAFNDFLVATLDSTIYLFFLHSRSIYLFFTRSNHHKRRLTGGVVIELVFGGLNLVQRRKWLFHPNQPSRCFQLLFADWLITACSLLVNRTLWFLILVDQKLCWYLLNEFFNFSSKLLVFSLLNGEFFPEIRSIGTPHPSFAYGGSCFRYRETAY